MIEPDYELDRLAHDVIGAAIEVHRTLGPGFLESVYEQSLGVELSLRGLAFSSQVPVSVSYKGCHVGEGRLDFLVEGRLIVELKAVEAIAPVHHAQVISYLKSTGLHLGLLLNFNVPMLKQAIHRIVLTPSSAPRD